jgi:transposase InsO family protein
MGMEGVTMTSGQDFAQLQLHFVDQIQWRYELIRPLVLFENCPARQRADETQTHPETVRKLRRRFHQQGMLGLLLDDVQVVPKEKTPRVSVAVVEEIARLKALYAGFHARELVRIIFYKLRERIDHKTAQRLWQQSAVATQETLPLRDYHTQPDRYQARLQVIKLYAQGWDKISISRFLRVSRPTVDAWIKRFETEHFAGLLDKSSAPKDPARKVWLPLMLEVYHLQKRHPDAGKFRLWSLLAHPEISVRTVARIMALNKEVYDDIPHVRHRSPKRPPQPHPYKAARPHQYWFIDGRMMDFALDGVRWWSLVMLDGYSRMILAGAMAPSEATWAALLVLYTACLRYGAPEILISDSGGAFTSDAFEAVCQRLEIHHEPIVSTHGESYKNLMETHFNIQRRLFDYQFSLTQTPAELEQVHQRFILTYNTTAHEGLVQEGFQPPMPIHVLAQAKGRLYSAEELARRFAHTVFPRTTNRYGCVTLHSYHFYIEEGVPHTQVLLWVYGEQLRAVLDHVVLAEYHCRYDWRTHKVTDIRDGLFYPTRFASPQRSLLPLNPQESLVLYRPQALRRAIRRASPAQQLLLFALVPTG